MLACLENCGQGLGANMWKILFAAAIAVCFTAGFAQAKKDSVPKVPQTTAAFVRYCAHHKKRCIKYFSLETMAYGMANAVNGTKGFCGADNWNEKTAYEATMAWIAAHPGTAHRKTNDSVDAALDANYPCGPSATFPENTADFIAYCRIAANRQNCDDDIMGRQLRLTIDSDPNFCLPKKQSGEQIEDDLKAIRLSLIHNAANLPASSFEAIEDAWRARYPCGK